MPSDFPRRPQLLKGAFAVYEDQTAGSQPTLILFQYNPGQIRRTLSRRTVPSEPGNAGGSREDVLRVPGPPVETITLSVVLDAADQLEHPDSHTEVRDHGLHPALATLEMMLYPPTFRLEEIEGQLGQGEVQISPQDLPLVLLVWGESRVAPVMLTSFSVTEEAFDPQLNPIRVKLELGLRVLTYVEFTDSSLGRDTFVSYQRKKENLARMYQPGSGKERVTRLLPEQDS
jgi:hypothetical protein